MNLRNKIFIPISILFLLGTLITTWLNISRLVQNENRRLELRLDEISRTLTEKSFPHHDSVLNQIHSISGFHLIVRSESEIIGRSLGPGKAIDEYLTKHPVNTTIQTELLEYVADSESFFVWNRTIPTPTRDLQLLAFYPTKQLAQTTRQIAIPQIVTSLLTLVVMFGLIFWIAKNFTDPIQILRKNMAEIAEGNFKIQPVQRTDELGELFESINEMSLRLKDYEQKIRTHEKLITLDQMGGGLAHQMRNSITGCRLALDFHRENCSSDSESLDVADRQLTYMEEFQKRFLAMAKVPQDAMKNVDLVELISNYLPLLNPFANHVQVDLSFLNETNGPVWIRCHRDSFQQMLQNLVINAIEAASLHLDRPNKQVQIVLKTVSDSANFENIDDPVRGQREPNSTLLFESFAELIVRDSGKGIEPKITGQIFQPLVTTKADGVGLGLAIVKQTAERHQAEINWKRNGEFTEFVVRFPIVSLNT